MENIINFISNSTLDNFMRFVLAGGMLLLLIQGRIILRRIKLSEFKHVATIHALSKSLGNGFIEYYKDKLESLIEEYNFKIGK
jgi:hypothetical protein